MFPPTSSLRILLVTALLLSACAPENGRSYAATPGGVSMLLPDRHARWESEFCVRTRDELELAPWIAASAPLLP